MRFWIFDLRFAIGAPALRLRVRPLDLAVSSWLGFLGIPENNPEMLPTQNTRIENQIPEEKSSFPSEESE